MGSTLTNILIHAVFSTKNREPFITPAIQPILYKYMGGIVKGEGGISIVIGGMPDHLHLVFKIKSIHSLSDIIQKIKGNSSKWVNQKRVVNGHFSWQKGFAAFSVSESLVDKITSYIKNQENHHQKVSFKDELIQLLQKHKIQYNKMYLWN